MAFIQNVMWSNPRGLSRRAIRSNFCFNSISLAIVQKNRLRRGTGSKETRLEAAAIIASGDHGDLTRMVAVEAGKVGRFSMCFEGRADRAF